MCRHATVEKRRGRRFYVVRSSVLLGLLCPPAFLNSARIGKPPAGRVKHIALIFPSRHRPLDEFPPRRVAQYPLCRLHPKRQTQNFSAAKRQPRFLFLRNIWTCLPLAATSRLRRE